MLRYSKAVTQVSVVGCQVKQKSLMSQELRLIKLREQAAELQRTDKLPPSAADKLTELSDRWTSTNQRLSK